MYKQTSYELETIIDSINTMCYKYKTNGPTRKKLAQTVKK